MKKLLFWLLLVAILAGCSKDFIDEGITPAGSDPDATEDVFHAPTTRGALNTAVYHEGAGAWMVSQPDPYTLENFQAAYEKLLSGGSTQKLTRAQTDELAAAAELQATHYALRLYPKTEKEQWKYEMMENINVSYVPFDYVRLSEEDVAQIPAAKTRGGEDGKAVAESAKFQNSYRYTVTYTDIMSTEGPMPDQTYILPILYVAWPVDKPLPTDIEYEMDYEVFLPQYALADDAEGEAKTRAREKVLGIETLIALEDEAIARALGIPVKQRKIPTEGPKTRGLDYDYIGPITWQPLFPTAYLRHWDSVVNRYVPVENVKVTYTLGSSTYATYWTDENGGFPTYYEAWVLSALTGLGELRRYSIPDNAITNFFFQHDKWTITAQSSTTPILIQHVFYGLIEDGYYLDFLEGGHWAPVFETHRAANFFFNGSHWIDRPTHSIRIAASHMHPNGYGGLYHSPNFWSWLLEGNPYIEVFEFNNTDARFSSRFIISSTLHELGHYSNSCKIGVYWEFGDVHPLIKESYASFVSWYLTQEYYKSLGKPNQWHETRSSWEKTHTKDTEPPAKYSPLFIDMMDTANQRTSSYPNRPNDQVSGMTVDQIEAVVKASKTWDECRAELRSRIPSSQLPAFDAYIADYDYWFQYVNSY